MNQTVAPFRLGTVETIDRPFDPFKTIDRPHLLLNELNFALAKSDVTHRFHQLLSDDPTAEKKIGFEKTLKSARISGIHFTGDWHGGKFKLDYLEIHLNGEHVVPDYLQHFSNLHVPYRGPARTPYVETLRIKDGAVYFHNSSSGKWEFAARPFLNRVQEVMVANTAWISMYAEAMPQAAIPRRNTPRKKHPEPAVA